MHLELPTLNTEGRVRDVGSYMYIAIYEPVSRHESVGEFVPEGFFAAVVDRVEPYQNISPGVVELGDFQIHHVRPHLNPKPFQSNLN